MTRRVFSQPAAVAVGTASVIIASVVALSVLASAGTFATWKNAITLPSTTITAASPDLSVSYGFDAAPQGASSLTLPHNVLHQMLPGDTSAVPLTVTNHGSMPASLSAMVQHESSSAFTTSVTLSEDRCDVAALNPVSLTNEMTPLADLTLQSGMSTTVCAHVGIGSAPVTDVVDPVSTSDFGIVIGTNSYQTPGHSVAVYASVHTAELALTASGVNSGSVFRNDATVHAMPVTVTNTTVTASPQRATSRVQFSSPSNTLLGSTWVWPISSLAACTVDTPISADALSFEAGSGSAAFTSQLAANESQNYCVRSEMADTAHNPAGTSTAKIVADLDLTFHELHAVTSAQAWLSSVATYPATAQAPGGKNRLKSGDFCADVAGGVNAPAGSQVGLYTCYPNPTVGNLNQYFEFAAIPGTSAVTVNSVKPTGRALSRANGAVVVQNLSQNDAQQWTLQTVNATTQTFQILATDSKQCLTAPMSQGRVITGNLYVSPCVNSVGQFFTPVDGAILPVALLELPAEHPEESAADEVSSSAAIPAPAHQDTETVRNEAGADLVRNTHFGFDTQTSEKWGVAAPRTLQVLATRDGKDD